MSRTLLFVEDDHLTSVTESRRIARHGYTVLTAADGEEALRCVEEEPAVELVLMDIELGGGMDGAETARRILTQRELPVIFLTGHAEASFVERVQDLPSYGYVLKGSGEAVLLESIRVALRLFDTLQLESRREQEYRELIETVREGIWQIDARGYTYFANAHMAEMLGCSREELLGAHLYEFMDPGEGGKARRFMERREEGIDEQHEFTFRRRDGGELITLLSASPVYDCEGQFAGALAAVMNITERSREQRSLAEHRQMLEDVHELAAIGIWSWDVATDTVSWSEELYRIAGRDPRSSAVSYAEHHRLYTPESWRELQQAVKRALEQGERYHLELGMLRPSGEQRTVIVVGGPRYGKGGTVTGLYGIVHDVTEFRRAQKEKEQASRRFADLLEAVTDSVFVLDREYRHILVNAAACRFTGYSREELLQHSLFELFPGIADTQFFKVFAQVMEERRERSEENLYTFPDGTTGWYEIAVYPVQEGILCISRNVSDRKQRAAELEQALEEKDALMRELNHRVKNNLNMISALVSMKEESGAKAEDLTDIRSQIDAIRIVHDKLHALGEVEEIRFGEYLEELLGTLFSNFSSRSVRVEVATDGAVLTTRTVIPLGLLVNETATNAIKHGFSDEQEARFEVRLSQTEDGRQWQLRISNSGRPFPRDVSLERPESLGLRLITSLAAQLEGRVELTRRPYPVFTITFPVDQES